MNPTTTRKAVLFLEHVTDNIVTHRPIARQRLSKRNPRNKYVTIEDIRF
jgi:hypothetical protein